MTNFYSPDTVGDQPWKLSKKEQDDYANSPVGWGDEGTPTLG
jgi:hypothetical protein